MVNTYSRWEYHPLVCNDRTRFFHMYTKVFIVRLSVPKIGSLGFAWEFVQVDNEAKR